MLVTVVGVQGLPRMQTNPNNRLDVVRPVEKLRYLVDLGTYLSDLGS